ncbi:hypothetical protein Theco_4009 (plasmid) [Thermobacillus composti KWC4]|uniref:Replication-relaxation n=1 Tax=Thermobacillus composti (strain DSM 18247 / JCM 13945 / KWC4) TaxID=717605 RepID=L0EIC4_THECK|nr:replication-relaxation family protein [Thermobacillus composti]AGA60013.1 hypothetical protein Theco_4009 [Thermobacillus composti KWC4]
MSDSLGFDRADQDSEESGKRKRRSSSDLTLGETIDILTDREWMLLVDLYKCRCMPQSAAVNYYFLDRPSDYYEEYDGAGEEMRKILDEKNRKRAVVKARRTFARLKQRGLIETSSLLPNEMDKPAHKRKRLTGETWYYLSTRGIRIVEYRLSVPEEERISKNELDMERARRDHIWELAKLYLELRHHYFRDLSYKFGVDWDWYPSMTLTSDNGALSVRPDAIFRISETLIYIELDRSTEPVQRSPFYSNQVSIERKLERYRDVIKLCTNPTKRNGYIAFVVPDAIHDTRLINISAAAERVFGSRDKVITGRSITDVFETFSEIYSRRNLS